MTYPPIAIMGLFNKSSNCPALLYTKNILGSLCYKVFQGVIYEFILSYYKNVLLFKFVLNMYKTLSTSQISMNVSSPHR